jgi:hypothetical protein
LFIANTFPVLLWYWLVKEGRVSSIYANHDHHI